MVACLAQCGSIPQEGVTVWHGPLLYNVSIKYAGVIDTSDAALLKVESKQMQPKCHAHNREARPCPAPLLGKCETLTSPAGLVFTSVHLLSQTQFFTDNIWKAALAPDSTSPSNKAFLAGLLTSVKSPCGILWPTPLEPSGVACLWVGLQMLASFILHPCIVSTNLFFFLPLRH